ncbi:MAG: energy transducer TonB, partial [Sphingomonadaceae bacterium]|nr:energy transducer TonB [Sphingomonadaceae bacterium]
SQAARAAPPGNPGSWVTNADYPSASIRAEEQGTTGFRLSVGADGRVADCQITSSSGSSRLDQTACQMLRRRARFTPARDAAGNPTTSVYTSSVRWQIPE